MRFPKLFDKEFLQLFHGAFVVSQKIIYLLVFWLLMKESQVQYLQTLNEWNEQGENKQIIPLAISPSVEYI